MFLHHVGDDSILFDWLCHAIQGTRDNSCGVCSILLVQNIKKVLYIPPPPTLQGVCVVYDVIEYARIEPLHPIGSIVSQEHIII